MSANLCLTAWNDPITGAPLQNANQVRFNYSGGPLRGLLDMAAARDRAASLWQARDPGRLARAGAG